ncbi:MAG: NAD-dependent dihydropyrimidine dehydrogenase subunit PreA [Planctomycetota bacterium]|nr:NAD-dependent dihydropyrimidine dehydrogenase subunit PreA [Planctomycetota bacterium]
MASCTGAVARRDLSFSPMLDLSVRVNGLELTNPFLVASGPPGTNARVIAKAFDEGWGGVVCKTVLLDASKIANVAPRYARMHAGPSGAQEIVGWENIELITDRPFETWLDEFRQLKRDYPRRVLIASIMEEHRREAWHEIVDRCDAAGVDGFELNLSCPHGLPERKMGSAMGQDPEIVEEISRWVREATDKPVWAKLTPNITDVTLPAAAALRGGCSGVSAINTMLCVMGVNLDTLRPEPSVEGWSTPGGYSGKALRPIALRMAMECARVVRQADVGIGPFGGAPVLSGIGGIESGDDAAQFLLVGCDCVQVCTGVMIHGYGLIRRLTHGLEAFMRKHDFRDVESFVGRALPFFTSHADLVQRQRARHERERSRATGSRDGNAGVRERSSTQREEKHLVPGDQHWTPESLTRQSAELAG